MRFLVTRPEPDATRLVERLAEMGHEGVVEPLLLIDYLCPDLVLKEIQALVITSRNALRWVDVSQKFDLFSAYPVYAVGKATAVMARDMGFSEVIEGPGTADGLSGVIGQVGIASKGSFLHLSGEDVADDIVPKLTSYGLKVERIVVYRSVAADKLSDSTIKRLESCDFDGVILMSPKTCKIWVELVSGLNEFQHSYMPTAYCISAATAEPLKKIKNVSKKIARKPNIEELLSLISVERN